MSLPNEAFFKDVNLTWAKHPITGALSVLQNEAAVKRALRSLVLTNFYERPYNPLFGTDLRAQLFENFSAFTELQLKKSITAAIENFEPRVELIKVIVQSREDQNTLNVDIIFRVVNQVEPISITVAIERIK